MTGASLSNELIEVRAYRARVNVPPISHQHLYNAIRLPNRSPISNTRLMPTLLLMRHAKSSWRDTSLSDEQRPLKKRGKRAAKKMGSLLRKKRLKPDLVLTSPATRARQTVKRVLKAAEREVPVIPIEALYFKGAEACLAAIQTSASTATKLLVVGHNPDLESLIERLTGAHTLVPTAAIAVIRTECAWKKLGRNGRSTLVAVYRPKDLPDED